MRWRAAKEKLLNMVGRAQIITQNVEDNMFFCLYQTYFNLNLRIKTVASALSVTFPYSVFFAEIEIIFLFGSLSGGEELMYIY